MKWAYVKSKGLINLGHVTRITAIPAAGIPPMVVFIYGKGNRDDHREEFYVKSTEVARQLFIEVIAAIQSDATVIDMDALQKTAEQYCAEVDLG